MTERTEAVFTAAHDREVRVSADRARIRHRALAWSMDYPPADLPKWMAFYESIVSDGKLPMALADLEVLRAARDLLASERVL